MTKQTVATLTALALALPFSVWAASDYSTELAGFHQSKVGATCASCHKNGMEVSDGEKEMNAACTGCHGDLAAVAEKHPAPKGAPQPPARHLLPVKPLFHASHVLRLHFLGSGRRYARAGAKMTCAFRQNVLP